MASAATRPIRTEAGARSSLLIDLLFLVASFPLFLGALLSDWAYFATTEVQWLNFAAWLIPGAMILLGVALGWAAIDVVRKRAERGRARMAYAALLLAIFVIGFINALVHAKDAWATMPEALALSVLMVLLASAAIWLGLGRRWRPST